MTEKIQSRSQSGSVRNGNRLNWSVECRTDLFWESSNKPILSSMCFAHTLCSTGLWFFFLGGGMKKQKQTVTRMFYYYIWFQFQMLTVPSMYFDHRLCSTVLRVSNCSLPLSSCWRGAPPLQCGTPASRSRRAAAWTRGIVPFLLSHRYADPQPGCSHWPSPRRRRRLPPWLM